MPEESSVPEKKICNIPIKRVKVKATCHIEIPLNVARHNMQKQKRPAMSSKTKLARHDVQEKTALTMKKEVI